MNDNNLKSIQNGLFKNLNNLEILWLHENEIETIETNIFDSLVSLRIK